MPNDKKKQVAHLKTAVKEASELLLATDPDREGESIGWHLAQVLKPKVPVHRIVFHEITEDAVKEALADPAASTRTWCGRRRAAAFSIAFMAIRCRRCSGRRSRPV